MLPQLLALKHTLVAITVWSVGNDRRLKER